MPKYYFNIFKILLILVIIILVVFFFKRSSNKENRPEMNITDNVEMDTTNVFVTDLAIENLKALKINGSEITIEETLQNGTNYSRYSASYLSEGYKIYGLLTIPSGEKPENGWPAIIFNHGYIPPKKYKTTERYVAYLDGFAKAGFVVFKPDYRGHGNSEGEANGAYGSDDYTIDVLNAVLSIKRLDYVNKNSIGMWGHSLGGYLTLRAMVVNKDIKAGVIWAGVVGSHAELLNNWRRRQISPPTGIPSRARRWRDEFVKKYGTPEQNPKFWNSISATSYLKNISGPVQIHHGANDETVPIEFSRNLDKRLKEAKKQVEYFEYVNNDHNLSQSFSLAMRRSINFFNRHLKDSPTD